MVARCRHKQRGRTHHIRREHADRDVGVGAEQGEEPREFSAWHRKSHTISARCNRVGVDNMGRERVCRLQNHMLGHTYLMLATCASSSPLITTGNQLATKVQGDTVEMKVNKLINCQR